MFDRVKRESIVPVNLSQVVFWGISTDKAEQIIEQNNFVPGAWLMRESSSVPGNISITELSLNDDRDLVFSHYRFYLHFSGKWFDNNLREPILKRTISKEKLTASLPALWEHLTEKLNFNPAKLISAQPMVADTSQADASQSSSSFEVLDTKGQNVAEASSSAASTIHNQNSFWVHPQLRQDDKKIAYTKEQGFNK